MKRSYVGAAAAALMLAWGLAPPCRAEPADTTATIKEDARTAGHAVAHGATTVGHTIADKSRATGHAIANDTRTARDGIRDDSKKAGHSVAQGARNIGKAVRDGFNRFKASVSGKSSERPPGS